jgi:hypothetical protein
MKVSSWLLISITLLPITAFSAPDMNTQKEEFYKKCLERNHISPNTAPSFCACQWKAISQKLTPNEIAELNALVNPGQSAVTNKVRAELMACKAEAEPKYFSK